MRIICRQYILNPLVSHLWKMGVMFPSSYGGTANENTNSMQWKYRPVENVQDYSHPDISSTRQHMKIADHRSTHILSTRPKNDNDDDDECHRQERRSIKRIDVRTVNN